MSSATDDVSSDPAVTSGSSEIKSGTQKNTPSYLTGEDFKLDLYSASWCLVFTHSGFFAIKYVLTIISRLLLKA